MNDLNLQKLQFCLVLDVIELNFQSAFEPEGWLGFSGGIV